MQSDANFLQREVVQLLQRKRKHVLGDSAELLGIWRFAFY